MVGVVARRLSGVVEALQPLLMRGRGKECTLSCEVLPLLWIACGHGEDTAFVRLAEELQPLIRTSEEDVKAAEVLGMHACVRARPLALFVRAPVAASCTVPTRGGSHSANRNHFVLCVCVSML